MSGFQTVIHREPAPAVQGDFASYNPRSSVIPPVENGFVSAATQALTVGFFGWGATTGLVYSSSAGAGANAALGFIARTPNIPSSIITTFLAESVATLQDGMPVTLQSAGDYWINLGGVTPGATIYADATTGAPTLTSNSGANPDTGFKGISTTVADAVSSNATTIDVTTGILTVAAMASGAVAIGDRVTGTGVPVQTYITGFISGTGAAGTYQTNSYNRAAVAAFTATFVQGKLAKIGRVAA